MQVMEAQKLNSSITIPIVPTVEIFRTFKLGRIDRASTKEWLQFGYNSRMLSPKESIQGSTMLSAALFGIRIGADGEDCYIGNGKLPIAMLWDLMQSCLH